MALDWPALRALIDAGAVRDVVAAMDGLDDRQRRALAAPVRGYARTLTNDVTVGWRRRHRRIAALRVAGTGCLSGADTLARWLTRQDLWIWNDDQTAAHLLRVLTTRELPWRGELTRRLAARLRSDRWDQQLWQLVAELVTSNGIDGVELPTSDGFVLGWMWAPRPDGRLADTLATDPFLEVLVPKLFEVDGAGQQLAWSASAGIGPEGSWPLALAALAADGRLPRAVLLDRCLGRLLRGGRPGELRGFLLLHQALDPDLEDVAARARDYTRLLADGQAAVARTAQRALRRLDDAGRLEPELLVEASRAVLFRPEKTLVRTQLSWLDAAARRQPDRVDELLGVVSVAFAQEAAELQSRALAVLVRHARHAEPAARAELLRAAAALPADLRHQAATALNGQVADPPTSWPALLPPTPRELPPPIGTPAEVAEELAAFFEAYPAGVDPVALERLLAGLVGFAHRDRAGLGHALEPVLARYRIPSWLPTSNPTPNHNFLLNEYQQLSWAVLAAVTPTSRGRLLRKAMDAIWDAGGGNQRRHRGRLPAPGPRLAMLYRLHEIAAGLWRPPPLLLATPTSVTGHLDPAELVVRLQQAADGGWEPWAYDLEQALLRLPREPDPATLARARRLPTPAGRRLAAWLADGGMPDPEVTRVVRTVRGRPRWLPNAAQPVTDHIVRVFATVTPRPGPAGPRALSTPLGIVHRLRPQRPPLPGLLCELAEPEHRGLWDLGEWLRCWPALLPSHRDVIAAHLQPRLTQLPWGGRGDGQVLPVLAEADGPVGPGLILGLALGLGARDPVDRAAAVDALVLLAGRRQLDGSTLGAELAGLVALDLLQLDRIVPALRDLARSGATGEVWAILSTAIPGMLPPVVERAPRVLPDLLALGAELAGAIGGCQAIPELAAITGRGGSSRLVAESRRLQHLLA
jgi:Family of unknown function (DUF6493)